MVDIFVEDEAFYIQCMFEFHVEPIEMPRVLYQRMVY